MSVVSLLLKRSHTEATYSLLCPYHFCLLRYELATRRSLGKMFYISYVLDEALRHAVVATSPTKSTCAVSVRELR